MLIAATSLLGAGCRKNSTADKTKPAENSANLAYLHTATDTESETDKNLRELNAAIMAFQEVKSFRAKLAIDNNKEKISAQIDVLKPDRFHGVIKISGEDQAGEVIGINNALYVKLADKIWMQVQSPAVAAAMSKAFQSAVDGDRAAVKQELPKGATVTHGRDLLRACEKYQTTITNEPESAIELSVCVADGLPKFISASTDQGSVEVEYFDYNELFTIERPTVTEF
jgi:hypothetical protein